jgi:hypothetical protein
MNTKQVLCHNCKYCSIHRFYSLCLFDDKPEETYIEPVYGKTITIRRYASIYDDCCLVKNKGLDWPNWAAKEPSKLSQWFAKVFS